MEALLDQPDHRRLGGQVSEMVGADRDDHRRPPGGVGGQPRAKRADDLRALMAGVDLLQLVHDDDRIARRATQSVGEGGLGVGARHDDDHRPVPSAQCRQDAGTHQ
jgi:hypothetical protein